TAGVSPHRDVAPPGVAAQYGPRGSPGSSSSSCAVARVWRSWHAKCSSGLLRARPHNARRRAHAGVQMIGETEEDSALARGWAGRLLGPFAEVRACEVGTAFLLSLTIFTILPAYSLLKVIREPLILMSSGAEVKSYAAAGQALLLLPVLRAHGAIAQRTGRLKLIAAVMLFCASNLVVFAVLYRMGVSIGLPFYLWVGTFNFLLVATFWSFANDIYSPEQGKRLFPLVGVGSTVGALAGAGLASFLLRHLGPAELMLLAAALLVATLASFAWVNGHQ